MQFLYPIHKPESVMKKVLSLPVCLLSLALSFGQTHPGYIPMGEDSLYYETAGSGRDLVFIHDGLLYGEVWNDQFAHFARDFRVTRYDRRGYGRSSPATGSYTHLEDLKALYDHLHIDSVTLIACSSGGALAIDFTLEYPEKTEALVLVGAVVGGFSYTSHMRTRGGHLPESFENDMEENLYYVRDDPYLIYEKNTGVKIAAVELLKAFPQRIHRRPNFVRPDIPPSQRLHEIKVPTLILIGEFDIPDVHAVSGALSNGIPNSRRYVIPASGHLIPMEQPAEFNQRVSAFLKANLSFSGSL
jgi:3-oxoadipate enol-lactonase